MIICNVAFLYVDSFLIIQVGKFEPDSVLGENEVMLEAGACLEQDRLSLAQYSQSNSSSMMRNDIF